MLSKLYSTPPFGNKPDAGIGDIAQNITVKLLGKTS